MRNGDQNLSNDHGFEFLSYIYGELDETVRDTFEDHLAGCDDCTFELAAYSDARLGIIEWRREDFDHLESPAIVIPWVNQSEPAIKIQPVGAISRFIEALSSFPLFAQAGMGLAAAALAVGVFYFAAYSPSEQTKEVAANKTLETKPFVTLNDDKPSSEAATDTVAVKKEATSPTEIQSVSRRPERIRRQMAAVKMNDRQSLVRKNETASTNKAVNKSVPTLSTVEEEKDNSLRLSDLFAEIGSSE